MPRGASCAGPPTCKRQLPARQDLVARCRPTAHTRWSSAGRGHRGSAVTQRQVPAVLMQGVCGGARRLPGCSQQRWHRIPRVRWGREREGPRARVPPATHSRWSSSCLPGCRRPAFGESFPAGEPWGLPVGSRVLPAHPMQVLTACDPQAAGPRSCPRPPPSLTVVQSRGR